jgi:hypothetical protein
MMTTGCVYIGTDETKRFFKIGKTKDPERRQREICHMNPTFKMIYILDPVETTSEGETEKLLHSRYAHKRVYGEWFDLSLDDLYDILLGYFSREDIKAKIDENQEERGGE